jgi:glutathione synthase/RimK-type ligase-like ATP-grasp enzyme
MGRRAEGQYLMRRYFFNNPYRSRNRSDSDLPPILVIYGFDQTHCDLKPRATGHPKARHIGGHFSLKELFVALNRFPTHRWTIAEDNINRTGSVPDHALVVNTIADADSESRSLESLAEFLAAHPQTPVINDPQKVLRTTRDANYRNLSGIDGVTFPRTIRFSASSIAPEEAVRYVEKTGIPYPLIIRETGTHTARTTSLIGNGKELHNYFKTARGVDFYVIEYIDERLNGKYFAKKRFFCIAGKLYPVVAHIDTFWNVRGDNRNTVMRANSWMMEEERAFLGDPKGCIGADNFAALENVAKIIDLDFFGIDFTLRKNGGVLIFEANAAMRHSFDHARNFPYLKPYAQTISAAFARMAADKLRLDSVLG